MSDILTPRKDAIGPEELLNAAGLADGWYDSAVEVYEAAEYDPGNRRQAEVLRAKYIRWLVNESYYGVRCDYETGSPDWAVSPEAMQSDSTGNTLDKDHSHALRYMVAQAGGYTPLEDDEAWFQSLA